MKRATILIGKDAHFFLKNESRKQRGLKPITDPDRQERAWQRMLKTDGLREVTDDSYGGGDGTYWGRWTSWNLEKVKTMLKKAGFTWKDGPEQEYFNV